MNKLIINEFKVLVQQLKLSNNDEYKYKINTFNNAINIIENYPHKIIHGSQLSNEKGIGRGIINRINEIIKYGSLEEISINRKNFIKNEQILKSQENEIKLKDNLNDNKVKELEKTENIKYNDIYIKDNTFTYYLKNIFLIIAILTLLDYNRNNISYVYSFVENELTVIHSHLIHYYECSIKDFTFYKLILQR